MEVWCYNVISEHLPTRSSWPSNQSNLIVCHSLRPLKNRVFALIQDEAGDIFSLDITRNSLSLGYFDSCFPCSCMSLLMGGVLFGASITGDHHLFKITRPPSSENPLITEPFFTPQSMRMELIDKISSSFPVTTLCPLQDSRFAFVSSTSPFPSISFLSPGYGTHQYASSPLPPTATPNGIWALKRSSSDRADSLIVISFSHPASTLPLAVGKKVVPIKDSGMITNQSTKLIALLGSGLILQVTTERVIVMSLASSDSPSRLLSSWIPTAKREIRQVSSSGNYIVLALSGGELFF
ncbi:hypothetical protein GEMRC1_008978 [Eukaryota sp. GEM-RC1]